jgi:uncharacterized cupin superfamily protein
MDLLEIYADEAGETHFRETTLDFQVTDFAPPSKPLQITGDQSASGVRFAEAPVGWDDAFHPTPRRQIAVLLRGRAHIAVTDGESMEISAGSFFLLSDIASKGHLTKILPGEDALFMLVGLDS